ncbi:MAG: hypothetical protein K8L99_14675 [Anaerolineae bacterium]|nr:hypothetical protein [Anaerolineae bacterium]
MSISLEQGEYQIGRYKVRLAHFTSLGWSASGPWMRATVTNRRIVLLPDEPQAMIAASEIPASSINRVWNACLSGRNGVIMALKDRQLLYLVVEWSQGPRLEKDVREMLVPPAQPRIDPRPFYKNWLN